HRRRVRHRLHRAAQGRAGAAGRRRAHRHPGGGGCRAGGGAGRAGRAAGAGPVAHAAARLAPMTDDGGGGPPSRASLVVAFATLYVIWGSTYLAIRISVVTWPPLVLAAVRFTIAGGVLYAFLRARGA